ncbi:type II toxin-antitoxin system RelE/ParE family toxin [Parabacteroides sp.]
MQIELRWMKRAVKHLNVIYDFLAEKDEQAAIKVYNDLLDSADTLLIFPLAGKTEEVLKDNPRGYRSLVVCKHYKLIYRVEKHIVKIVAVWDCRQNPKKLKSIL